MRPILLIFLGLVTVAFVGCGDDNSPTGGTTTTSGTTTTWNSTGQYFVTTVDATSSDEFAMFSFAGHDTLIPVSEYDDRYATDSYATADLWDIAFRREVIKLNGGSSTTNNGDVVGASLGVVNFDTISIADTAGVEWMADAINYFIDNWYTYNPLTHVLSANQYVWSMVDAGGVNYLKFRVDSMVGAGAPPSMGTIYLTYFYQSTPNSMDLSGTTSSGIVNVGSTSGYFDFSTGSQVTPASPTTSTDWDIKFENYEIKQNSGPNGSGKCSAFPAYGELTTPTAIDSFVAQPAGAPTFPDIPQSVLTDWYSYNPDNHQLTSLSEVYLIKTGGSVYKLQITSYYANVGGVPTSGNYSFKWVKL